MEIRWKIHKLNISGSLHATHAGEKNILTFFAANSNDQIIILMLKNVQLPMGAGSVKLYKF